MAVETRHQRHPSRQWGTHDRPFAPRGSASASLRGPSRRAHQALRAVPDDREGIISDPPVPRALKPRIPRPPPRGVARESRLRRHRLKTPAPGRSSIHREEWDLFVAVFAEPQCVGHPDVASLDHAAADATYGPRRPGVGGVPPAGRLPPCSRRPANAVSVVIASHGMAEPTGGPQLIPEVLLRLTVSARASGAGMRSRLPPPHASSPGCCSGARSDSAPRCGRVARASAPVPGDAGRGARRRSRQLDQGQPRGPRAVRDHLAGPRAQLIGRFAVSCSGCVDPVSGADRYERETATEAFGPDAHPDIPDLMVAFREASSPGSSIPAVGPGRTGAHPVSPARTTHRTPDDADHRLDRRRPGRAFDPGKRPDLADDPRSARHLAGGGISMEARCSAKPRCLSRRRAWGLQPGVHNRTRSPHTGRAARGSPPAADWQERGCAEASGLGELGGARRSPICPFLDFRRFCAGFEPNPREGNPFCPSVIPKMIVQEGLRMSDSPAQASADTQGRTV